MFDYLSFAFLMFLGQLSPGPDFLLVLKNSFNHGLRATFYTIAGITTGIIIHTTIALTGLTLIITRSATAYNVLKYGGAAYLSYLGVRLLLSLRSKPRDEGAPLTRLPHRELSDRAAFVQGFLTNILNPKIIVIISSVLLMFLSEDSTLAERLTYGTILVVEGVLVWIVIAWLLQTGPAKRQFQRWETPINAAFGIFLIAFALRAILVP